MKDIVGWQYTGFVLKEGGITIEHSGDAGAVMARMHISETSKGYSSVMQFADPTTAVSSKMNAGGLRIGSIDGDRLEPVVVARNIGTSATWVKGKLPYTDLNGVVKNINIPQRLVLPGKTASINLRPYILVANLPSSITFTGIELEYTTAPGTVLLSAVSPTKSGKHVYQVPLMDPQRMPSSAGGFPWKVDGDYNTIVYIKNETSKSRKFTAVLIYNGGNYNYGLNEIKPNETIAIDFKKIKDLQVPDIRGNVIPLNLTTGQIAWSARGPDNNIMSGRSEQVNEVLGIASTYACYNCCGDSFLEGWIEAESTSIDQGQSVIFTAWEQHVNCYHQNTSSVVLGPMWSSSNESIVSINPVGQAQGISGGNAQIFANWSTDTSENGTEFCYQTTIPVAREIFVSVSPVVAQIDEVGFTGDHMLSKWPPPLPSPSPTPKPVIDDPDGSEPTWKRNDNPDYPVSYTKGSNITMFATITLGQSIPSTNAKIRVKNGSTIIATKDFTLSGNTATITDITTTSALETTVKTTTQTFTWEISYNDGASWHSMGTSGPHKIYWTYATPLNPPFRNDAENTFAPIYDEALKRATGYANGASTLSSIISNINTGVDSDINYDPSNSIVNQHPLNAYTVSGGCQCSDLANLLRGLLRTIGVDGTTIYIWAGADSSTLTRYTVGSSGNTNPSFRIIRDAHDSAAENPHFKYHAVVSTNNTWYDPSYGMVYSSLTFSETANNNTPQQQSSSLLFSEPLSGFSCPH